jgi:hypothetical protein
MSAQQIDGVKGVRLNPGSAAENLLAFQLKAVGIPFEREVAFAKPRRWRADFVVRRSDKYQSYTWPGGTSVDSGTQIMTSDPPPLLIEIDGGTWSGGRHVTGSGVERDCEKLNAAVLLGYRCLRFTPAMVESGVALQTIEKALA